MKNQEQQDLESLVKNIFKHSKQTTARSSRSRLKAILGRSLHELAIRDILIFFGHLISAMFMMLSSFVKLLVSNR